MEKLGEILLFTNGENLNLIIYREKEIYFNKFSIKLNDLN